MSTVPGRRADLPADSPAGCHRHRASAASPGPAHAPSADPTPERAIASLPDRSPHRKAVRTRIRFLSDALVTQVPSCLGAGSAIVYFSCSEGIRHHVALLARAARLLAEHLR